MQTLGAAYRAGAWRWCGLMAGLLSGSGSGGCGGESKSDDLDALSDACVDLGVRVRECGLLTPGTVDCSRETLEASRGSATQRFDGAICGLDCLEGAECGVLEAVLCGTTADVNTDATNLDECLLACAEEYGFRCATPGSGPAAVPRGAVCDAENDCADGSDEVGCSLFACGDGVSVSMNSVCDGFRDCADGLDEVTGCPTIACTDGSLRPAWYACDGEADCPDASDEAGCPAAPDAAVLQCGG
jgi:Low-density lipoprotein receptor domain class A